MFKRIFLPLIAIAPIHATEEVNPGTNWCKTADIATMKRNAIPIRAYTSVDESRFMRGVAADFGYKDFSLLTFASVKKVDAKQAIADSTYDDLEFISTIVFSCLIKKAKNILYITIKEKVKIK